jgi:GNAT superfamily N-acetyltransferase
MIEVRPFDPNSATPAEWAAVHVFRRARNEEDTPDEPVPEDAEFERQTRHRWPLHENRRWHAWAGDEIAGVIGWSFRREATADYDDYAAYLYGWCGVRTHRRRQGIATDLLRPLRNFMRERNKFVATFETSLPDGHRFLTAIGGAMKHEQIESRAPATNVDWAMLARWRDAAIPKGAQLRWEIHADRVPRKRIESLIPQFEALNADLPLGELDVPPIRSELPAWLAWYEELDRHGGDHTLIMLVEGDAIAAVCESAWDARYPDRVYQMLTAVARPWRGRGLAKGVKAAMMRLIHDRHPDIRFIATSNANVNAPMLSINKRLGFAEHRRTASYQIGPDAISDYLTRRVASVRFKQPRGS